MFSIKIFSVSFGMGVVSGVVMPFQFGTNWSRFSDATANVLSPLAAIGIVSLWTPFIHEDIARRWFSWAQSAFSLARTYYHGTAGVGGVALAQ
jgi:hypothetical protein